MNRKIRTAITALAALTALSVVAIAPDTSAAKHNDGRFWTSVEAYKLQGFGGSATDDDCGEYAQDIEDALFNGSFSLRLDPIRGASAARRYFALAKELDNEATDNGCVVIYTPPPK